MEIIKDFIKQHWNVFSSSWFNFVIAISFFVYVGTLFFYSKKRLIIPVRIVNFFLVVSLLLCTLIGYSQGYSFAWDTQDKIYLGCIILFFVSIFLDKILKYHSIIEKILVVTIFSFVLLIFDDKLNIFYYLFFITLFLFFLHITYSISCNKNVFLRAYICLSLNMIVYYLINSDRNKLFINEPLVRIVYTLFFLYFVISSIVLLCFVRKNNGKTSFKQKNLFSERKYDLERLNEYLERYNLIGIDAIWGNGKSFLFTMLQSEFQDKYHFISISVLSMRVEQVEAFVLGEIGNLLEENRIYSSVSKKIKGLLKQSFFHNLGETFLGIDSYSEQLKILKADISKLQKPIIITFEDIDRLDEKSIVYKIFALSDAIHNDKIKILFQYEEKKLLSILEEKKVYLEKYLQHTINLTNISFERMLNCLLENERYKNLSKKDFDFLTLPIRMSFDLQKLLCINKEFNLINYGYPIRKFELFLEDVEHAIKNEMFHSLEDYKKKIITFYFIKHFDYDLFELLNDKDSFIESCIFFYKDKSYTIIDVINNFANKQFSDEDIEIILSDDINRKHFIYLILFDYDFDTLYKEYKIKTESRILNPKEINDSLIGLLNEAKKMIQSYQLNDKIDRLVKNQISAGKSENTDFEIAVKEMNEKVLNQPEELREAGYKNLSEMMYHGNFDKSGNQTIFRFGISDKFSLFQAFSIYESNASQWIKLIDFFIKPKSKINSHTIQILNYCKLDNRDILLHIYKRFSELTVENNLNNTISYKKFIYEYLFALVRNGYMRVDHLYWINEDANEEFNKEMYLDFIFPEYLEKIKELEKIIDNSSILNELEIIKMFIIKNIELINAEKEEKEYVPRIESSSKIIDPILKITEEYKKLNLTKSELQNKLDEEYLNKKINLYEYECILNNVFPKRNVVDISNPCGNINEDETKCEK